MAPGTPYVTRDPLAIRSLVAGGLAVTLVPELLAGQLHGIATVGLGVDAPRRDLYALTPAAGRTGLAEAFIEASTTTGARREGGRRNVLLLRED